MHIVHCYIPCVIWKLLRLTSDVVYFAKLYFKSSSCAITLQKQLKPLWKLKAHLVTRCMIKFCWGWRKLNDQVRTGRSTIGFWGRARSNGSKSNEWHSKIIRRTRYLTVLCGWLLFWHRQIYIYKYGVWGIWSNHSLSLLSSPLWPGLVVSVRFPSMG